MSDTNPEFGRSHRPRGLRYEAQEVQQHPLPDVPLPNVRRFLETARRGQNPRDPQVWFIWMEGAVNRLEAAESRAADLERQFAHSETLRRECYADAVGWLEQMDRILVACGLEPCAGASDERGKVQLADAILASLNREQALRKQAEERVANAEALADAVQAYLTGRVDHRADLADAMDAFRPGWDNDYLADEERKDRAETEAQAQARVAGTGVES